MIFFSSKTIERECLAPAKMLAPLTCLKPQRKQIIGARHFHLCLLRIKLTHNVLSCVALCHLECGPPPNSKCGGISPIHDKPIRICNGHCQWFELGTRNPLSFFRPAHSRY